MSINLWKPEPDVVLHQALGKLAEECAELSQAIARCLIQGFHEEEPVTGKLNRTQLFEEVADVKAAMRWLFDVLDEPFKGESDRERRKFDGFKLWQSKLETALSAAPQPLAVPDLAPILARLIKWDTDYPVNCHNGYAGLKALDEIIADAKTAIGSDEL